MKVKEDKLVAVNFSVEVSREDTVFFKTERVHDYEEVRLQADLLKMRFAENGCNVWIHTHETEIVNKETMELA